MCHSVIEGRAVRSVSEAVKTPEKRRSSRRVVIAFVTGLLSLIGMRHAAADSGTGSQDPNYLVSASLTSSGADPNTAAPGDMVTAAFSVTNQSSVFRKTKVQLLVLSPTGLTLAGSMDVSLSPRQTQSQKFDFPVPQSLPAGAYAWTLKASDDTGATPGSQQPIPMAAALSPLVTGHPAPVNPEPPDPVGPPGKPGPVPAPPPVTGGATSSAMVTIVVV